MLSRLGRVLRRPADAAPADADYEARLREETAIYADQEVVHDLPPIFHYWSNTHLLPVMQLFGFSSIERFFADALERAYRERRHDGPARFASVGAGNCDTEIGLARALLDRDCPEFVIECLELNPMMLERGAEQARSEGVEVHVVGVQADFNAWNPRPQYDGVLANQALHHVVNLEGLFDAVLRSLTPEGRFVVSDMIGRNGHLRWPEARRIVEEFWRELPSEYRFHKQLRRQEDEFLDWDCSQEGFEGIRAQDVLPLLVERFHFELFLGFANVVDVFIDRGFGPHFDPRAEWDRDFIDRVHARDVEGLFSGELKPTHMMGVMRTTPVPGDAQVWGPLTPAFSVRPP
jgi:SAM-dependent methyltransferase